jgi:hypothetical protein
MGSGPSTGSYQPERNGEPSLQCSAVSFHLSSPSLREEELIDSSLIICDPSGMRLATVELRFISMNQDCA